MSNYHGLTPVVEHSVLIEKALVGEFDWGEGPCKESSRTFV